MNTAPHVPQNKFRNIMNTRFTKNLFYETTLEDKSSVLYTLKDWDHQGFPSLYLLYLDAEDLTEYDFAKKHLDGWEHWEMLTSCAWFKPYILRWRKELQLRIKAKALNRIKELAKEGKDSFQANKYLLSNAWIEEETKRGRPSKDEIKLAAKEELQVTSRIQEDFDRLVGGMNA